MTIRILLIGMFLSLSMGLKAQSKRIVESAFAQIKTLPEHYGKGQQAVPADESYERIVKLGPEAIPYLVGRLTDTTLANINNPCKETALRRADIAFFLINDIEQIPYFTVTQIQWCLLDSCSVLPVGFLDYLENHRLEFQTKYVVYLDSKARKDFVKTIRRDKD